MIDRSSPPVQLYQMGAVVVWTFKAIKSDRLKFQDADRSMKSYMHKVKNSGWRLCVLNRLARKVAIITGAASGIGRATALLFAKEGANVVVADINDQGGRLTVEEIKSCEGEAIFVHTDVTKMADAKGMVLKTLETFARVDVLFNNAGTGWGRNILETKEEDWDEVLDLNLKSMYMCSKHAIPAMIKSGGGSIVNMGSIGGLTGVPGAAFASSKGGVVNLTRSMAAVHAKQRIRVNCICPGVIRTPMTERWVSQILADPARARMFLAQYPMGRIGKPEEVAHAVLFLASDEASFITGIILPIDGGYTAHPRF
jgi:NAD(P)-dependent dehydrogenase (short-subunit alcohol dehydrogenase family)